MLTNRKKYRVMRSVLSEPCNNISDRITEDIIRQSKINEHETTFGEYFYESLSDGTSLDGKIAEQSLLCWIELIENENLHKAVKSLSIEDQIFISYIVKEQRTQRELAEIYKVSHRAIGQKFERLTKKLKNFI